MAYDQKLAERIKSALSHLPLVQEKKMMSGVVFMVDGKMCVNATGDGLMVRIDPELTEEALAKKGCKPMEMKGKVIKGYVVVDDEGIKDENDFRFWIELALSFNPKAKASKRPKKKNT